MNGDTVLWEAGLYICQVQVIYSFESIKLQVSYLQDKSDGYNQMIGD